MTKKDQCRELMNKLFGPASAAVVDNMDEDDCVEKCKEKTKAFLGETVAKAFDNIA